MRILFICKHNRFRSKVAEALFKKYDKNKNEVKSAGVSLDLTRPFVCENVKDSLKKRGINEIDEQACELNDYGLKWADKIIVVSNNVAKTVFSGQISKKTEFWAVEDADECEREKIKQIVDDIEFRIKRLVENLNN